MAFRSVHRKGLEWHMREVLWTVHERTYIERPGFCSKDVLTPSPAVGIGHAPPRRVPAPIRFRSFTVNYIQTCRVHEERKRQEGNW